MPDSRSLLFTLTLTTVGIAKLAKKIIDGFPFSYVLATLQEMREFCSVGIENRQCVTEKDSDDT